MSYSKGTYNLVITDVIRTKADETGKDLINKIILQRIPIENIIVYPFTGSIAGLNNGIVKNSIKINVASSVSSLEKMVYEKLGIGNRNVTNSNDYQQNAPLQNFNKNNPASNPVKSTNEYKK